MLTPGKFHVGLLVAVAACTGSVSGGVSAGGDGGAGGASSGGRGGADGSPSQPDPSQCTIAPGPAYLRRLSQVEYVRTVRDLTGIEPALTADAPRDSRLDGFDNNRATLALSTSHLSFYAKVSSEIAERALPAGATKPALLGCEVTGAARRGCLEATIAGFGRRAFRRPLDDAEKAAYSTLAGLAENDPDPLAAFRLVISTFLQSPWFLYRVEIGTATKDGKRQLTGYELATRLSYLLWGTTPSVDLLAEAERGRLEDAEGAKTVARAMLADPRAREGMARFTGQMMRLADLETETRDATTYPLWGQGLREAMAEETRRVLEELIFGNSPAFTRLFDAPFTFVNAVLAKHYGLPAPRAGWERVDLQDRDNRGGILTHGSVLTMTGHTEITAPIARGAFVRDVLLCDPLPPPPVGVPPAPEDRAGKTVRQILEEHGKAGCVECHRRLDATGFGLERYDLVGGYREKDELGTPLSAKGHLEGASSPEFTGGVELGRKLATMPEARACLIKHVFRYGFGRHEVEADACALEALQKSLDAHRGDLAATLVEFAGSTTLREIGESP
ncbi:MAG: DUF1592 domain-containing protein [Deltaproteobacteria bacterium]|nr:DUF1592 domain-containing protein [Deltaproteobacteria bacterium]